MNQKEAAKLRRLEVENEELKRVNSRHIQVYSDLLSELIDLRTRLRLVEEALQQAFINVVKSTGGVGGFVTCAEDAMEILNGR